MHKTLALKAKIAPMFGTTKEAMDSAYSSKYGKAPAKIKSTHKPTEANFNQFNKVLNKAITKKRMGFK